MVKDRESEVREVLENYNNMERECLAAKQTVCPEIRDKATRLREHWDTLRAARDTIRDTQRDTQHDTQRDAQHDTQRDTQHDSQRDSQRDAQHATQRDVQREETVLVRESPARSEAESRKSSVDSQHSGECHGRCWVLGLLVGVT